MNVTIDFVEGTVGEKFCNTCKTWKPLESFAKDSTKKSGYQSNCKECKSGMSLLPSVYGIHNLINDKIYIGSSLHPYYRWDQHKSALAGGYHANSSLQLDFNEYGLEAFEFRVLEEVSVDVLRERELEFLEAVPAEILYNIQQIHKEEAWKS